MRDVLRLLADTANVNLVVGDDVVGKVTLKLVHVRVGCRGVRDRGGPAPADHRRRGHRDGARGEVIVRRAPWIDRPRNRSGSQRDRLAVRDERQRHRVQAVAQPGRRWAIVEHVAEVGIATHAADLDPAHAVADILDVLHVVGIERLEERRPAGAGLELRVGLEQRQATQPARVDAGLLVIEEQPAERTLGPLVQDHVALLGGERCRERLDARLGQRGDVVTGTRTSHTQRIRRNP